MRIIEILVKLIMAIFIVAGGAFLSTMVSTWLGLVMWCIMMILICWLFDTDLIDNMYATKPKRLMLILVSGIVLGIGIIIFYII